MVGLYWGTKESIAHSHFETAAMFWLDNMVPWGKLDYCNQTISFAEQWIVFHTKISLCGEIEATCLSRAHMAKCPRLSVRFGSKICEIYLTLGRTYWLCSEAFKQIILKANILSYWNRNSMVLHTQIFRSNHEFSARFGRTYMGWLCRGAPKQLTAVSQSHIFCYIAHVLNLSHAMFQIAHKTSSFKKNPKRKCLDQIRTSHKIWGRQPGAYIPRDKGSIVKLIVFLKMANGEIIFFTCQLLLSFWM